MTSVSVALCTFNGARYVGSQLESIVSQPLAPLEIVVSDDGSTDGTVEIIQEFSSRSPIPVRLVQGPRKGVAANFEYAIGFTTGEFVALSDQDDVWRPDHLSELASRLTAREGTLLVHSDARLVDSYGKPSGSSLFRALRIRRRELDQIRSGDAFGALLRRNLVTGATAMIRRSLLDYASPFPANWVHDEWLAIVAASLSGVAVIEAPLIDYRQHDANQIGVEVVSTLGMMARLFEPADARHLMLSVKWAELAERASALGLDSERERAIAEKARFESSRGEDPIPRLARIPAIVRRAVRGEYSRFASQGNADVLRDLLSAR